MNRESNNIYRSFEKMIANKRLLNTFAATCVLTIVAHGFNFFNSTFANDRVTYFGEPPIGSEIGGKWFTQFYTWMRGYSYLPWLMGVLSILYLTVSVYIAVDILRIERTLSIWLIAGLYTTNVSVITANFYGMDDFMFALMMGSLSVWAWYLKDSTCQGKIVALFRKHVSLRVIVSLVAMGMCAGVYGSYASVAPTLAILGCIALLMNGETVRYVFLRALEYVATLGIGLAFYYMMLRIFLVVHGTTMQSYMGEDRLINGATGSEMIEFVKMAYKNTLNNWRGHYEGNSSYASMPEWMAIVFLVVGGILFAIQIYRCRDVFCHIKSILLLMLFLVLFPFSAGLIYVMAFGNVHYLMIFSFVYFYVAIVKLAEMCYADESKPINSRKWILIIGKVVSCLTVILLCVFVYYGIRTANIAYNGMEKKYTVSKSIATRLIDRIESTEGYDGTEIIVLVGHIMDGDYFKDASGAKYWKNVVSGLGVAGESTSFSHIGITPFFLIDVMGFSRPVQLYSADIFTEDQQSYIAEMPWFPADGSVEKIGNTVVVKLSDAGL